MLLITPSFAAKAIKAKCGGNAPSDSDPGMLTILRLMTPRVEEACNVFSLTRGDYTERFELVDMPRFNYSLSAPRRRASLRLTNGFLVPDAAPYALTLLDPTGVAVDLTDPEVADVDRYYGMVHLFSWKRGAYTLSYRSGFTPATADTGQDPEDVELTGIPEWMKSIAVSFLVEWYRGTALAPSANDKISYEALMSTLARSIHSRVYGKYQRPRVNSIWGERR